ncbi:ester cyclase [Streptomyces sp. NPDC059862]|uniref:ester cyclase n=1 Tax=unclassified Streptomyces TaxID=2593676 RepID=UPI0036336CB9
MSLEEKNKEIARDALRRVWSEGDLAAVDDLYAADFVSHQNPGSVELEDVRGLGPLRSFVQEFREAFEGFSDEISLQCAEGHLVATRFISSGRHTGTLWGIAPTGREVSWSGIVIDRVVDGRIAENWVNWDSANLLRQLEA